MTSNKDRYTEKMTSFTRNGGIKGLQRYGKQASGTYWFIDNLSIGYSGNRISGVSDGAPVVTQNGSLDFPGGSTSVVLSYNAFGALSADPSRGITSITYDNFGNPTQIQFTNARNITNVYSATGEKLKTSSPVGVATAADAASPFDMEMDLQAASSEAAIAPQIIVAQSSVSYHGPIIYRNNAVDKVLFQGGYATVNGSTVTFHYYTQDYLGNNRAVINGSTGAIEQTIAYYPFGAVIADLGTPTTGQPYKFGCKELLTTNGLNEYDFGARNYYSAVPGFTKPDPMAEKYYWLSPYLYCSNNPVNLIDPTGKIISMPSDSSVEHMISVMMNLSTITDDDLFLSHQDDGTYRIMISNFKDGEKRNGTRLIRRLNGSDKTLTINGVSEGGNNERSTSPLDSHNGVGSSTEVNFNPNYDPDVPIVDPITGMATSSSRPAFIGLAHELIHADRDMRGISINYSQKAYHQYVYGDGIIDVERIPSEDAATIGFFPKKEYEVTENDIRKENNIRPRATYSSFKRKK